MIEFDEVIFLLLCLLYFTLFSWGLYESLHSKDDIKNNCVTNNGILISKYAGGFLCLKKDSIIEMKDNK